MHTHTQAGTHTLIHRCKERQAHASAYLHGGGVEHLHLVGLARQEPVDLDGLGLSFGVVVGMAGG